jgi:hypothetical protein
VCPPVVLLQIKISNAIKKRTSKNEKSQDCRNSDYLIVVDDSVCPEQTGGGHKAALCHDYDAVSPAVDSYFHNGHYSGACHSQLCAARASQAFVAS